MPLPLKEAVEASIIPICSNTVLYTILYALTDTAALYAA